MPAKPIAYSWPAEDGAKSPAATTPSPPPVERILDLLAEEIVADAQRAPAEVVERFNTQQQGE